jgi:hypothetical protein
MIPPRKRKMGIYKKLTENILLYYLGDVKLLILKEG